MVGAAAGVAAHCSAGTAARTDPLDWRTMASEVQEVFIDLGGQDDNLGDSALRAAYLEAVRGEGCRFHVFLGHPTADYVSGLPLRPADQVYFDRTSWLAASSAARHPVHLFNAGEINPLRGAFPYSDRSAELQRAVDAGGAVVVAGIGLRNPRSASSIKFHQVFRDALVVSWRDQPSRDAVGFGEVAPDWAFSLGADTSDWAGRDARPFLAVTLRFDRAWPESSWIEAVQRFAADTSTRIVTVAQVARDAPRAVQLAEALGGEYLVAPSTSHADLDSHVRAVYGQSLAVVSDRAHGLVMGATEGAYPLGSSADPEKISRMLRVVGLDELTGHYDQFGELAQQFESRLPGLAPAIDAARVTTSRLGRRIRAAMRLTAGASSGTGR